MQHKENRKYSGLAKNMYPIKNALHHGLYEINKSPLCEQVKVWYFYLLLMKVTYVEHFQFKYSTVISRMLTHVRNCNIFQVVRNF